MRGIPVRTYTQTDTSMIELVIPRPKADPISIASQSGSVQSRERHISGRLHPGIVSCAAHGQPAQDSRPLNHEELTPAKRSSHAERGPHAKRSSRQEVLERGPHAKIERQEVRRSGSMVARCEAGTPFRRPSPRQSRGRGSASFELAIRQGGSPVSAQKPV